MKHLEYHTYLHFKLQPSLRKSHGIEIKSRAHLVVSRLQRTVGNAL